MAVYTVLEQSEIETLLESFGLGTLMHFEGVPQGVENTNYFLTIDPAPSPGQLSRSPRHYVLTLFESLPMATLEFYVELLGRLAQRGLPVPAPVPDIQGVALHCLRDRPALITPRFPGSHAMQPGPAHCAAIGGVLADLHRTGAELDLELSRASHRDFLWLAQTTEQVLPHLEPTDRNMAEELLSELQQLIDRQQDLPCGLVHGDLFRDNALFIDQRLTGVVDFFSAGPGILLYDLAVAVNDWCFDANSQLRRQQAAAMLAAYCSRRPLSEIEREWWPALLRLAAFRFWISRLAARHITRPARPRGALVELKNPEEYRQRLLQHRRYQHEALPDALALP